MDFLWAILSSDNLSPHGICLLWRPELIWTHVAADAITGLAYISIAVVLADLTRKRPDFRFSWISWCFAAFLLSCAATHFMSVWTLWSPDYGVEALVKAINAAVSVATAILLWPLLPRVLALPSSAELTAANEALALRVKERDAALVNFHRESEQRQRAQDMLRQAQKMEAVGQLSGGVAHDFNNLFTVILMSLDRGARSVGPENPKLAKSIEIAIAAAERAAALTGQMLAFARKQPLKPAGLGVNELVSDLAPLLKNALGEQGALVLDLAPDAGRVWADRNQLEQALLNLAVNARDAMPQRGKMTITTRPTLIRRGEKDISGSEIEIADTGCGMSDEVLASAFDPFFTTKPIGSGSGLGLSQVYGFVKQSGGVIRLESIVNVGTRISIKLPDRELEYAT